MGSPLSITTCRSLSVWMQRNGPRAGPKPSPCRRTGLQSLMRSYVDWILYTRGGNEQHKTEGGGIEKQGCRQKDSSKVSMFQTGRHSPERIFCGVVLKVSDLWSLSKHLAPLELSRILWLCLTFPFCNCTILPSLSHCHSWFRNNHHHFTQVITNEASSSLSVSLLTMSFFGSVCWQL